MLSQDSKIIIVGGGVFGLSTSLWLARAGYKNITIYDRCAFDKSFYNPLNGCDGASADINKVFRMAYADQVEYQQLAIEARDIWQAWTDKIMASSPSELPDGLTPEDKLLHVCGSYFLGEGTVLRDYYRDSLVTMEKTAPEFRKMQFLKDNGEEEARLRKISEKWVEKYHAIDGINNGNTNGFIDIQAGITIADKACVYTRFLCEQAGVNFVLGDPQGKLSSLIVEDKGVQKRVKGIKTYDGLSHFGDLVIVAAGSWTASIIPEAHHTVEATAGTVMFIDIPKERQDLWKKFHPDNYPVWSYRKGDGDNYYQGGGFPISKEGRLKFGFRGRKAASRISTPRTKYSKQPIDTVPLYGLSRMKEVIAQGFPELVEFGFTDSRLCWYTDSPDNNYVVDYVPNYSDSLFICTGGSGHAFKFLPILGKHIKNQLERVPDQFTAAWKWRVAEEGKPNNGLLEGEEGPREMSRVEMADREFFICLLHCSADRL
ncbi:FAD dependent oxidoreductase [Talaromyces proteolyticus]|uniref:FAD dependent oxidoreductase n=1 Tax=Talaromyces proteolyticus TaxID=1131652 RepID=A0AAD4PZQ2_9EURO|nr:FAD dependent oxidoreductase [Talaromyces proteolyticus]KAH8696216.1 FAD dependent oxidoreductase [Talaromyces proteolyticus]